MMMLLPYFSLSHKQLPYHHLHHPHDNKLFLFNVQRKRKELLFAVRPSIQQLSRFTTLAADKSGGFPFSLNPFSGSNKCETCKSQGSIECPGCKGTGRNKKNGNIFERWKCFECQGFGLKSCPQCGKGGLTPEQRGER